MPYLDSLDIANRAIQHVGGIQIVDVDEVSKNNFETSFAYDKVRRAELRRNVWRFSIRKAVLRPIDTDTMILNPALYGAGTTYLPGAIVKDSNSQIWISFQPDNIGNTPGDSEVWDAFFGPLSVSLWTSGTAYYAGELVYKLGAVAGTYQVYLSLQNANDDDPGTGTAWSATTTYRRDDVVAYLGTNYRSLKELSVNITPVEGPNWTAAPTLTTTSIKWRALDSNLKSLLFTYPIGSGPSSQASTRNVFRLPSGFLREAPQDAKAGSTSYLGASSAAAYNDWSYEGDYIVSSDVQPIIFRFVADITSVSTMDDMFCEGLACRVATAICEPITQSGAKLQTIASAYKLFMGEARTVNAIETGPVELPEDDWVACRG